MDNFRWNPTECTSFETPLSLFAVQSVLSGVSLRRQFPITFSYIHDRYWLLISLEASPPLLQLVPQEYSPTDNPAAYPFHARKFAYVSPSFVFPSSHSVPGGPFTPPLYSVTQTNEASINSRIFTIVWPK